MYTNIQLLKHTSFFSIINVFLIAILFSNCSDKEDINPENQPDSQPNNQKNIFFTDDFETGDHSTSENGFKWSDNNVAIDKTPNGTSGLKFIYGPNDVNKDSWQEQRFHLGNDYSELWIKYDLYIPQNFHHRSPVKIKLETSTPDVQIGDTLIKVKNESGSYSIPNQENWGIIKHISADTLMVDQLPSYYTFLDTNEFKNKRTGTISKIAKNIGYSNNNKFLVLWQGDYGHASSGNTINLSTWYSYRGNSRLSYSPAKDQGTWQLGHQFGEIDFFDKETDLGKWMEIVIHTKIASDANNDGILEVSKNGKQFFSITDLANHSQLGYNYFQYGYLLGWSNSGFDEETILYIDNVEFSTNKTTP
ncbi:hypothetical protein [Aquimarina aquimarini]|uniref:hypothetical protein n=1 Tax=Aquimarina aquimarini TaxID=1191734 RepID=UPI000D562AB8|nr:hypothetical protein [Aquimarina aquimarini]